MKPRSKSAQVSFFSTQLSHICSADHALVRLAHNVNWEEMERHFTPLYCGETGRPGESIRLMVGLTILKAMFGDSDERLIERWVENPYWQYFCGEVEFQHEPPIDPTTMTYWRRRIKEAGIEKIFSESVNIALKTKTIHKEHLERINVDTTVQEKAVAFPTDAKLLHKARLDVVKNAEAAGIPLRQSYERVSKKALLMVGRHLHSRRGKLAKRALRKLKTILGRVIRDVKRKIGQIPSNNGLQEALAKAERIFAQERTTKNKIYSIHAPEVECIAKGKARARYEFGCKVSFVTSSKGNFFLGALALHGNPYDGHTLRGALDQMTRILGENKREISGVFVDQGYKGHEITEAPVHIVGKNKKRQQKATKRWLKRRSAIEPLIGHAKNDNGDPRNYLLGVDGDKINAIAMALGFNFRKILRTLARAPRAFARLIFAFVKARVQEQAIAQIMKRQFVGLRGDSLFL